jgi:hypothetical protein
MGRVHPSHMPLSSHPSVGLKVPLLVEIQLYQIEGANFSWNIPAHCGRVEHKSIGFGPISRTTGLRMMTGNIVRTATATR